MNSQWLSVACSLSRPFTLDRYQRTWGERFNEFRSWLVPTEDLSTCMNCPRTGPNNPCTYRVVEINDDKFVGICDMELCDERAFTRAELVQYQVDFARLNKALASLLGYQTRPVNNEGCWLLELGTLACADAPIPVHLVGGTDQHQQLRKMRAQWDQSDQPRLLLFPLSRMVTENISNFIKRAGWPHLVLEGHIEMTAHGTAWLPDGRERWEQLLNQIHGGMSGISAVVQEAAAKPYVRAIERGFAAIGKDFSKYRIEIDSLRSGLAQQLGRIAREVEPEFFQIVMTVLVCGSVRSAAEKLGSSKSSLDRRLKDFVAKGGLYATLSGLLTLRTEHLGRRRLESLNPKFADHIADREPPQQEAIIEELVQALQEADPEHWAEILIEFSESLQGTC